MCTCITYANKDHYFGRNLDLYYSYQESVTLTPRNFPMPFRHEKTMETHPAILGMAFICQELPLYYDAVNEYGLAMAGLNFPKEAVFGSVVSGKHNIAVFELIPWILCKCKTLAEAKELLSKTQVIDEAFAPELPVTPEHWCISDTTGASVVLECTADGMHVYDNPVGVMTNSPAFPFMLTYLRAFRHLTPNEEENTSFAEDVDLPTYSLGMGAYGIPGDLSSPSRFVRAAFARCNASSDGTEGGNISEFFHLLEYVVQPRGCVRIGAGKQEITVYSSCMNQEKGIYYWTTYENHTIKAFDMHRENLDSQELVSVPLGNTFSVSWQN